MAPAYQTASIVRLSSLAEAGANSAATAKRSTWTPVSISCPLATVAVAAPNSALVAVSGPAAMTSVGAAVSCTSVISSGINDSFL